MRRTLLVSPLVSLLVLAPGCNQTLGGSTRDVGARDGGRVDASGADVGPPPHDAGVPIDAAIDLDAASRGAARTEICGNLFDDDSNGMIDDGCDCAVGTERPCWLGPPDARGVGACHEGVQHCNSAGASASWGYCDGEVIPAREIAANGQDDDCDGRIDEPGGICVPLSNDEGGAECANGRDDDCDTRVDCDDPQCVGLAGCPPGCVATETLCWGGNDEDCDGTTDCDDTDCHGDPSCATGPCPPGQTPTYRERTLPASYGGSYIAVGDGDAIMPMTCEPGPCASGQVRVIENTGADVCVPPPPPCPAGQSPTYVASGAWRCDPPCDLIIHYGSLFGGQARCAGRPPTTACPTGQSWTYVFETDAWECLPTCANTTYDRILLDGAIVCVPC